MKQVYFQSQIKIWYKALPGLSKILWPIVDFKLNYGGILTQPFSALIDSGANQSILHPLIAEAIGFNRKNLGPPKKGGLSASGKYKSWKLPELDIDIYGYKFNIPFTVIDNKELIWPCILGEDSLFHFARLDFYRFKGFFEIRFRTDIN